MKKHWKYLIALLLILGVISELGVGYYYSGSAVMDLKEELTALHGAPYTGREVESGVQKIWLFPWNRRPFS